MELPTHPQHEGTVPVFTRVSHLLLVVLLGPSASHQEQYPVKLRITAIALVVGIASWFVMYLAVVLPALITTGDLKLEQGADSRALAIHAKALFVYMVWCIMVRVIVSWPRVSRRAMHWYSQATRFTACWAKLLLWDAPLYMYMFTSMLLWLTLMNFVDAMGHSRFLTILMTYASHSVVVGALCLLLTAQHNRWLLGAIRQRSSQKGAAQPDIINHLETRTYDEAVFGEGQCAICLATWQPSERIIVTPCQHAFHEECLASWLQTARTCALCRQDLVKAVERLKASSPASPDDGPSLQ